MLRLQVSDLGDSTHSGPEGHGHVRCHAPNSIGVIYVTISPPDFFFSQLESKLHLE